MCWHRPFGMGELQQQSTHAIQWAKKKKNRTKLCDKKEPNYRYIYKHTVLLLLCCSNVYVWVRIITLLFFFFSFSSHSELSGNFPIDAQLSPSRWRHFFILSHYVHCLCYSIEGVCIGTLLQISCVDGKKLCKNREAVTHLSQWMCGFCIIWLRILWRPNPNTHTIRSK